jgi:hypothetical protein
MIGFIFIISLWHLLLLLCSVKSFNDAIDNRRRLKTAKEKNNHPRKSLKKAGVGGR